MDRKETLANGGIDVAVDVVEATDIERTVLEYAAEHDMDTIIIGAAEEGLLRGLLFGEIPEDIGERFDGQVLMVKKYRQVQSIVQRWTRATAGRIETVAERIGW